MVLAFQHFFSLAPGGVEWSWGAGGRGGGGGEKGGAVGGGRVGGGKGACLIIMTLPLWCLQYHRTCIF